MSDDHLNDAWAAAYHEAGHLLARILTGDAAARAKIAMDGRGQTTPGNWIAHPFVAARRCLAGPLAEARHGGRPLEEVLQTHGRGDYASARRALAADPRRRSLADALAATRDLLRDDRVLFDLALALMARGALDGAGAAVILANAADRDACERAAARRARAR